ncbi:MAG: TetR/AcrR family transcriptional regulator, partial [Gemmatimonadota bacterium]
MATVNREQILGAFERLVARHGLDRVTMKELAREAGISVGSIYRHFESKDDLVLAIEEKWRNHVEIRTSAIVGGGASPEDKLHDIVVRHIEKLSALIRENRAVYELLMGALRLRYTGRTLTDTRREMFELMIAGSAEVLAEGVRRGEFDVEDAHGTARLFVEAFGEYFAPRRVMEREHAEVVRSAEGMFALLMKSIRKA